MLDGVGVAPGGPWVAEAPGPLQSFEKIAPPSHREGNSLPCRGGQTGAHLAELGAGGKEVASLACGRGGMGQERRWTLIWASLNSEPGEQAVIGLQRVCFYFLAVIDTLVNISLFLSFCYMSVRVVPVVKKLPASAGDVRDMGQGDPLEEGMATRSSVLAWRLPWTEEPGGLQSIRSHRVGHD